MAKIPSNLENPVDNIVINLASKITPLLHSIYITPNLITTAGLLVAIISIYFFINGQYKYAAVFFFISYILDCFDGHLARKYNMVTEFGDYYDHFVDVFKTVTMVGLLLYVLFINGQTILIILIIILLILQLAHLGCQERYVALTNKDLNSTTLSVLKPLCPNTNLIHYSRFFGCGTFFLIISIIIYNLDHLKK